MIAGSNPVRAVTFSLPAPFSLRMADDNYVQSYGGSENPIPGVPQASAR